MQTHSCESNALPPSLPCFGGRLVRQLPIAIVASICLLVLQPSPSHASPPNRSGIEIRDGKRVWSVPSIANNKEFIGCMEVLNRSGVGERGTLVCRVGSRWLSKRVGPASDPQQSDGDCLMFVNLGTGAISRSHEMQPGPDFISKSTNGKFVAFASSTGWAFSGNSRDRILSIKDSKRFHGSEMRPSDVADGLKSAFVGSLLVSIWDATTLRPVWELRYPNDGIPEVAQFRRPWELSRQVPIPWWAIDEDPILYNDPVMGFSPSGQVFVALFEKYGVWILNLDSGKSIFTCPSRKECTPVSFLFADERTVRIFQSSGVAIDVRISDGTTVDSMDCRMGSGDYPYSLENGYLFPAFCTDSSRRVVTSVGSNKIFLRGTNDALSWRLTANTYSDAGRTGVSHVELSRDGRYAGLHFKSCRETVEHLRFKYSGYCDRFERLNLLTGRIEERVVFSDSEDITRFDDSVRLIELPRTVGGIMFGACLNESGDGSVIAIPSIDADCE
jgi:hypothetical protein